jgi:uncharacterized protein (DUF58 family)
MQIKKSIRKGFYLTNKFFIAGILFAISFVMAFFFPVLLKYIPIALATFIGLVLLELVMLYFFGNAPYATRTIADRLSNGEENIVNITVTNTKFYPVKITIIDELPQQFQKRDFSLLRSFAPKQTINIAYTIRPAQRGEYFFGKINLFVTTTLGFIQVKFAALTDAVVPVYPAFLQLKKYELITKTYLRNEQGNKQTRRLGNSMEFEQIKDYVIGDDVRNINWKATARKGNLMVNAFVDERSQQIYCVIDKGRLMKMPFNGLSLLDYAINSALILSSICLNKQDKVGLITFADKIGTILPAERKPLQKEKILQALYKQKTDFLECDFDNLYLQIRNKIKQRSLVVLYTNFESLTGLNRQLPYIRSIAKYHLVLVVFFQNTELQTIADATVYNIEDLYIKTIAEKFAYEKRLIVKELNKHGVLTLLTTPEALTVNAINKYVELKTKQLI